MHKSKDGDYALELFIKHAEKNCCNRSFKLIIMDINMPRMDGVTASKKILEYCRNHNIIEPNICALTAYDNEDNI